MQQTSRKMKILFILAFITLVSSIDQQFLKANEGFSASIYKKFAKQAYSNFLLSPFSAEAILALTQSGSRGSTAEEIRNVLNFTNNPEEIELIFRNLLSTFGVDEKYKFHTANKIYVKDNFSLKPEFKQIATEVFRADIENVDFSRRKEAANIMNKWVENQTNNKIKNLVAPSSLNYRTRAAVINALYFKANWSRPFLIAYTKRLHFYLTPTEMAPVDMMLLHDKTYNFYENSSLKAKFLELPFKGNDASMVVVLPDEIDGLPFVETQIKEILKSHKFSNRHVNLGLPKFKIETPVNLKKLLKSMGISRIFDDKYADLSGIAGEPGDLVIDKISQKTFIDVAEEGVEAAAATYIRIAIPMSAPSQNPVNFRVDRPFIFYIKVKDVIIFVGRVIDPTR